MSSVSDWPESPLDAAQCAFALLTTTSSPMAFDGRGFDGLPDRMLPLDELRHLLLSSGTGVVVRDAVWRELVMRARRDGPAWMVAAVGLAMPGLRRMAGLLSAGWRGDTDDLDSELLLGFVERVHVLDVDASRICGRLIDAGVRRARRARDRYSGTEMVHCASAESRLPVVPWDHPDLVLARAVAAGVLDPDEARLIGATRLGHATLAQVAQVLGLRPALAGAWRRKAELRLRDAIQAGELDYVTMAARRRPNKRCPAVPVGSLLGAGEGVAAVSGTQHGPLVGKRSARQTAGFGAPGIGAAPAA